MRALAVLCLSFAVLTLTACGGSSSSSPDAQDDTTTGSDATTNSDATESDQTSGDTQDSDTPEQREADCRPYTPAEIDGSHTGTWSSIDDVHVQVLEIGDVGGGLVHVTVSKTGVATGVTLRLAGQEEHVHNGVLVGDVDGVDEETFVFRAQGQHNYELVVSPFVSPSSEATNEYTISWRYEPLIDCYEENNTAATARLIPLDYDIEAFAHAGIIEGDSSFSGPGLVDLYKFELDAPATVRLAATKPSDAALIIEFWDAEAEYGITGVDLTAAGNQEIYSDELSLEAGTHYVRVAAFGSQTSSLESTEPLPAEWNTPYRLRVERR